MFKPIFSKSVRLTKNKTFEIESYYFDGTILNVSVEWTTKTDHAGLLITFALLGIILEISIRDNRHWNYEMNDWMNYE